MFFEKIKCLASTYKSGGFSGKLPKKTIYIKYCESIEKILSKKLF